MVKAFFFDADGVVIKSRSELFSTRFARMQGVDPALVVPFFKNDMKESFLGKGDIRAALEKYLKVWKWEGTADEFLLYWFKEESPADETTLSKIDALRQKGYKCYLATGREPHWAAYLLDRAGLRNRFDGFLFSYELGYDKEDPRFFTKALETLNVQPSDVVHFDDSAEDLSAACAAGIDAQLFTGYNILDTYS